MAEEWKWLNLAQTTSDKTLMGTSVLWLTFPPGRELWAPPLSIESHWPTFTQRNSVSPMFLFPPLAPIQPALQLFRGDAAGSKPMRKFMQIECARPLDESFLPARKFELVDPRWWYMWPWPNAWLQDKVITLPLVYTACPLAAIKRRAGTRTHKQWVSFLHPGGNKRTVHSFRPWDEMLACVRCAC